MTHTWIMRLVDLQPQFIRREVKVETWTKVLGDPLTWKVGDPTEQVTGPREYYVPVDTLAEADGIHFTCPKCYRANAGKRGSHRVLCWFTGRVTDDVQPGPGRWPPGGTGYLDLTFGPGRNGMSSVKLDGGCAWHGHIVSGGISVLDS